MAEEEKASPTTQPGAIVSPGSQPAVPETSQSDPTPPNDSPTEADQPSPPAQVPTGLKSAEEPKSDGSVISWTASEFIAHEKSSQWYLGLAVTAILLAAIIYLLTRDKITSAIILIGAAFFGITGARQPRQLQYQLDDSGVQVGPRFHPYEEFRSFSVVPEGAFSSIVFMPLKRFATLTTIYYAPEDEEKIVNMLADRLPFEEYRHDVVDRLMRRVRF
jgi:hypothetical protein